MNAWLKRCVFNLDLNRESVSEPERYQEGYSRVWDPIKYNIIIWFYASINSQFASN